MIKIIEKGTCYQIPIYKIEENISIIQTEEFLEIQFARVDKKKISEDEYKNAIKELDSVAPYLGFKDTKGGQKLYLVALSENTEKKYIDQYNKASETIKNYLNPTEPKKGIIIEDLFDLLLEDMKYKNILIPSVENQIIINKIIECRGLLELRKLKIEK